MLYMPMSLILNILLFKVIKSITFFVMQIRVIFVLPSLMPLPWCPGQLPQSPTPRSTTVQHHKPRNSSNAISCITDASKTSISNYLIIGLRR